MKQESMTSQEAHGFIYKIDYTDGTCYYGKKNFARLVTYPPLKGYKRKRKIYKESDWRTYEGSSKKGAFKVVQRKTILQLARTNGRLTYLENRRIYMENAILRLDCINDNISGKIYAKTIGREHIKWSVK